MKISVNILILTTFAFSAFGNVIKPNVKRSLLEGSQAIISDNMAISVPGENSFDYCDQDYTSDILQLDYVNLNPKEPKQGQTLLIEAAGNLLQEVNYDAYFRVKVSLGLIVLFKMESYLCDQISKVNMTCPLEKGPIMVKKEVKLPLVIPPGHYMLTADAFTDENERLLCLTTKIKF